MSAGVSELKARLASVKQTRQITNAMYLLSASRLKKLMPGMGYAGCARRVESGGNASAFY